MLVDSALIQAGALVNGTSIVRESAVPTTYTYYHVELDDHSLILADNTPAKTFVDNIDRLNFDNWAEHEALYPNGKSMNELPYSRAKSHRQVPVGTRVMLADRAQMIGYAGDVIAGAPAPELSLQRGQCSGIALSAADRSCAYEQTARWSMLIDELLYSIPDCPQGLWSG